MYKLHRWILDRIGQIGNLIMIKSSTYLFLDVEKIRQLADKLWTSDYYFQISTLFIFRCR